MRFLIRSNVNKKKQLFLNKNCSRCWFYLSEVVLEGIYLK